MFKKVLKWFLFGCISVLAILLIFILATPKEIVAVAEIDVPVGLEIEIEKIELDPVSPKKINVNYKDENGVMSNIGDGKLPFSQLLCCVESAQVKELRQGGRELFFTIKTKTKLPFVMVAITFSFLGLVVFSGFLRPWN